jgi:GWxTD domain-containing protein
MSAMVPFLLAVLAAGCLLGGPAAWQGPAQPTPLPDKEWKRWLDDVEPLLLPPDRDEIKVTAPSQRRGFRDDFWQSRDPDPATPDNENRTDYERRVATAEKRFRPNGRSGWNDCGRTFLLLGKPDRMVSDRTAQHFAAPDPLRIYAEEENSATEVWVYRNSPRLPPSPDGYEFRFNPSCDAIANPSSAKLLVRAAISYLTPRR